MTTFFLLAVPSVFASGSWSTKEEGSHFFIEGDCFEDSVKIDFFSKFEEEKPIHEEIVQCENEKFVFSGDLLKEKLKTGNYILAIDEVKSQSIVAVKNEDNTKESEMAQLDEEKTVILDPEIKFLESLANFEQSILDMQNYLSKTKYSGIIKSSVELVLNEILTLAGKITNILWSSDDSSEVVLENEIEKDAREEESFEENISQKIKEKSSLETNTETKEIINSSLEN